jgi:hypothetical protein
MVTAGILRCSAPALLGIRCLLFMLCGTRLLSLLVQCRIRVHLRFLFVHCRLRLRLFLLMRCRNPLLRRCLDRNFMDLFTTPLGRLRVRTSRSSLLGRSCMRDIMLFLVVYRVSDRRCL